VVVSPTLHRRPAVRGDLRRSGRDLEEEAPLVGGLPGAQILDLMKEMNARERTTFIFSTHDVNVLTYAKTMVKIKDGIVAEKSAL